MIISKQIKESKICNLGYIIRSGSYNEKDDEHGLAHLVEHMLFKGTNKRDYKEINNSMESIGGYLNAETNFRSEEHTSEPQSRQYLVCRLLLEKKKKIINNT